MIKTRKSKLENRIKDVLSQKKPKLEDIISAVDDYEKNNLKTIEKLKKKKGLEIKKINGAIKQTLHAHGPITKQYITSASKRIYGALLLDEQLTTRRKYINAFKVIITFMLIFLA
jgi:hypothetical protein